ncbi:hypothetical protein HG531_004337 [Fusarium graminearum]|nr:hypothetical protein HG531_004337 [Fusarium graminearum]
MIVLCRLSTVLTYINLSIVEYRHAAHDSHQSPHVTQLACGTASPKLKLSNTRHGLPAIGISPNSHNLLAIAGVTFAAGAAALGEILFAGRVFFFSVGAAETDELVAAPFGLSDTLDFGTTRTAPFEALNALL